jgi:hypothetical protein
MSPCDFACVRQFLFEDGHSEIAIVRISDDPLFGDNLPPACPAPPRPAAIPPADDPYMAPETWIAVSDDCAAWL